MQAMILAAGMGSRLKDLTSNNTKCMVKVNGISLIDRMLQTLDSFKMNKIIIVVGYKGNELIQFIQTLKVGTPIEYIENDIYDKTNNIYSLYLARQHLLEDDTILLESDIIFEREVLRLLIEDKQDTLALVDKYESWMDGTCVKINPNHEITDFISKSDFNYRECREYYKTVNLYKFSSEFSKKYYVPFLEAYVQAMGKNVYYEQVLKVIALLDSPRIKVKPLNGQLWYEIDDVQDLDIAESLFADDNQKLLSISHRYGGYWRYPKLLDFCYLVNPYYPPTRMIDEICASSASLICNYPSGMNVNTLLAAKNAGVHVNNIVVGNGASELIKGLMETMTGRIGNIVPTFEEYPNRYNKQKMVSFTPDNPNFSYQASDIIDFFQNKKISHLIVINPDNPSGNCLTFEDLMELIHWTKKQKIGLVVDESFIDFANECDTLIRQDILDDNPHLVVIKSISKSYGVPGLRLGILASGNRSLIEKLKNTVSIWNINSFAEFYMQIEEKYKKDYVLALQKFRLEREDFYQNLSQIEGIRVVPSKANYFLIELTNGVTSTALAQRLLVEYNIYIKDLSQKIKMGEYIRIAIRNKKDNERLCQALRELLPSLKGNL